MSTYRKRPRQGNAPKRYFHLSLFLIVIISIVSACAPRALPVNPTLTEASPAIEAVAPAKASATFMAEADAQVNQADPKNNSGKSTFLQVDGGGDPGVESFIRFTITGIASTIQGVQLRVYDTTNASKNGPAVYGTSTSWTESAITWETRPERLSDVLDNKGNIATNSWVQYDVTSWVKGNGTYSFVLVADSADAATFSSRQGKQPPQLAITLADGNVTLPAQTSTATETVTAVSTTPTTPTDATMTPTSSSGDVVFVGAGDISTCDNNNDTLTAQLLDSIPGTVFTTGDNAYDRGTTSEYANCYDPTWGRHKARTQPVPGNHEYNTPNAEGYFQYFNNIAPYYAYNLGSWRIYALNSEIDVGPDSPQVTWLQADLASNPSQCVLAYWHRPRWSSGSHHGSDESLQTLWQVLYQAGAELVLNGHEHNYERFVPMNALGQPDPSGMREIVVGTGGRNHYDFGTILPTSEVHDSTSYGVLKLTLHPTGYDWQFVPTAGGTLNDSGSAECH